MLVLSLCVMFSWGDVEIMCGAMFSKCDVGVEFVCCDGVSVI